MARFRIRIQADVNGILLLAATPPQGAWGAMRIFDVDSITAPDRAGLTDQLLPDEQVHQAFKAATTTILFTDRRILTVQLQVLLSERLETSSFSYRTMRQFSLLQGAPPDGRSEIRIWIGSDAHPLHLRANEGTDFAPLQRLLAGMLQ